LAAERFVFDVVAEFQIVRIYNRVKRATSDFLMGAKAVSTMFVDKPRDTSVIARTEKPGMCMTLMDGHDDVVEDDHKHPSKEFDGVTWTFNHLQAFAMRLQVPLDGIGPVDVDVVVLFTNHCYSREVADGENVNERHIVMDGKTRRLMDSWRYELSLKYLPQLVHSLDKRRIKPSRENFVTIELEPSAPGEAPTNYAMFFDVIKDRKRKRRLLLRVKSAYVLERPLSKRELEEKPIRFHVLLKRTLNSER